ncbi:unnamed protein product [Closterium sp. NIES-53]
MYALSVSAEGDCYRCVPPDPGIAAAPLGASESGTLPGTAPAEALHTFTLDSGASCCFFRDSTTLTPLPAPFPVRLDDPSGGPVVARSSTVLLCPTVSSDSLSGLHLPSFSTNLVSTAALQDAMVTTTTPGGRRVSICMVHTKGVSPGYVSASGRVAASCSCRLLSHQTLLWHHRLGHPSLPRLHGMHSRLLISHLPRSLPPLPPSPAPPCLPCVEGRQRAAPHSPSFPPTTAPLQTLHMNVTFLSCVCTLVEVSGTLRTNSTSRPVSPYRTGEVGDASVLRVWGSRDPTADKLSARAIPYAFLGFVPDAPGWQFYHPTSRRALPSQDITFDESAPFYHPLPGTAPVEVAVGSGAALGAASGGAASGGAEPGDAGSEGTGSGGEEPGGAEPEGVEPGGAESEGGESGGAEPEGDASSGGPASASPRLSPKQLREWLVRRARLWGGALRAGGAGDFGAGGAGVTAGAGGTGGTAAVGHGGARTRAAGAGGSCASEAGAGGARAGGAGVGGTGAGGTGAAGARAVDPGAGGTVRPRPYFVPLLQQSQPPLQPAFPLTPPSAYAEQSAGLTERHEPASRPVLPVRIARRVPHSRPPPIPGMHAMALRPSSVPLHVPLPASPESSLPEVLYPVSDRARTASPTVSRLLATSVRDPYFESAATSALIAELLDFVAACPLDYATPLFAECASASPPSVGAECALDTDVLEDTQEDFECLAATLVRFASMLLASEGGPDAPDIPTPCSYAEAITGPYSSKWQAAMDAEMASWKSTGTYADEVPPPGANIVDCMWNFTVKRLPGSTLAFKARYVARGFSHGQGIDYFHTFSPTPKMTTLRVLLHVAAQRDYELHSLDFSKAFLQGSLHEEIWLRRPPGFTGSFPAELQKRHTCIDLGPSALPLPVLLATTHSSVYQPLALSSTFGRVLRRAWGSCAWRTGSSCHHRSRKRFLGSRLSSSCVAEIYAGAMAAQELRWLTYLLTDLGEQPRSPPVLYVDNNAMTALCQEHRLEHKMKHIALRYFLARELQQHGQLRLAYVATRANTADIFTKARPLGDHQHFSTMLGLSEPESASPPSVGGECALGTDVLEDRQEDFECLAAAVPHFSSMLLAPEGDPDAPDIPTPRSYEEAITGPYSSQWQAAMDAEMASWKVKRLLGSLHAFKARYVARGFSQRQGKD